MTHMKGFMKGWIISSGREYNQDRRDAALAFCIHLTEKFQTKETFLRFYDLNDDQMVEIVKIIEDNNDLTPTQNTPIILSVLECIENGEEIDYEFRHNQSPQRREISRQLDVRWKVSLFCLAVYFIVNLFIR